MLDGEHAGVATVSVTFLSPARMRALNRRARGPDRATDVLAFRLVHDGAVAGDIYVCGDVARQAARAHHVREREELLRLVVHGTLHILGYDHPAGAGRTTSPMWRRQERYLRRLVAGRS